MPTTLADLKAAARQLARRRDTQQQKTQALASTRSALDSTQRDLDSLASQIKAIASRLQLPVDATLVARAMQMIKDKPPGMLPSRPSSIAPFNVAGLESEIGNGQVVDLGRRPPAGRPAVGSAPPGRAGTRRQREDDLVEELAHAEDQS